MALTAMKMTAPSSGWPTREIALLIADPSPEKRPGTEPISVLVSGATTSEMPSAEQDRRGQDVEQSVERRDQARRRRRPRPARLRVGREPREPEQAGGHQQRTDDEEAARPEPAGHASRPGSTGATAGSRSGGRSSPAAEGRVAEHALEDQRLVAERHVQGAVHEERREVDRRERAGAEEPERDERVRAAWPSGSGTGQRDDARRRSRSRRPCPPTRCCLAADEPEREPADRERRDERAEPVEARRSSRCRATPRHGVSVAQRANATSGTLIRNATRQPIVSTRMPPTIGPRSVSAEVEAAQMPNARPRASPVEGMR